MYMMCLDKSSDTIDIYNLYPKLYDMNNLYNSFLKCKKNISWKHSVQLFEANLFSNLLKMRKELMGEIYKQKPFYEFDIKERGKDRHIKSIHIYDRVVQRCLCDYILLPILQKQLIYDNGASIKGKGVEFTRKRLQTHLEKYYRKYGNDGYVLTIDFAKFFDSIPHEKSLNYISNYIKDEKVFRLLKHMMSTFDEDTDYENAKSLGIGSQISQIIGMHYPTKIDTYCKNVKGCKYYGRYMDDIYIIHPDKGFLKQLVIEIRNLCEELGLNLNEHKTQIYKLNHSFPFMKIRYILTDTGHIVKKPNKDTFLRERRKLKKLKIKCDNNEIPYIDIETSYKSWRGNLKKYDCYQQIKSMDSLYYELFQKKVV